jgi:hypothetical protein
VARPWLEFDAALTLVECSERELLAACRDGDVKWRVHDESGALLKPPYTDWTGRADLTARPPRFEMREPYQFLIIGGAKPPAQLSGRWRIVEIERRSLLAHFAEPEPLAVRVVGPIGVILHRAAAAVVRATGRKPGGRTQSTEIVDAYLELVRRGEVTYGPGTLAPIARRLQLEFSNYSTGHIENLIRPHHQEGRRKT